ncbi:hypothetical protein [Pseudonocardia charpentierae]|uniref:TIGR02757 family protein n=1 Tax=Pseudonocardia charpentierae TaxID=3075545 RepID=A0ABU2N2L4_9PSEU|nr:hypothetical protein [Pseudonocardia sp. DSM 45834]MDT0348124.1 hypothetical protein [Pseudonocardia sp. DSM 45834]
MRHGESCRSGTRRRRIVLLAAMPSVRLATEEESEVSSSFAPDLVDRIEKIRAAFEEGALGEKAHEKHPGLPLSSRENYLYFTLAPALNYQRQSHQLWRAAEKTFHDPATAFVYEPSLVGEVTDDELRRALTTHALATRPVRHTETWRRLCGTLAAHYHADPREFLASCDWDVVAILDGLKRDRKRFPVLSGPKMSNYWLFILSRYTDVKFENMHEVSIIPDIHVKRATERLGVVEDASLHTTEMIADIWRAGLRGTGIMPSQLHGPLWFWSRAGFPEL